MQDKAGDDGSNIADNWSVCFWRSWCHSFALYFFTEKFTPYDSSVAEAMKGTSLRLTQETTMWRAWIGFNASHSLGVMLLAAVYIPLASYHFTLVENSIWFSLLPVAVGLAYLCLAKAYWFKIPFFGILMSLACFIGSAWLVNT